MTKFPTRGRGVRATLVMSLVLGAMALSASGVAAGPPPPFTASPSSVDFGSVYVFSASTATVTVDTGRKDAVLEVSSDDGQFTDLGTGTCLTTWANQVPANSSCTIDLQFAPNTGHPFQATLTIASCMKWHLSNGLPACDMSHYAASVSLTGTGLDIP